jgi:Metallo-beta-lactamase superfamily
MGKRSGVIEVTAIPAGHGDALWIEYGAARDRHRLLIDGGPVSAYRSLQAWIDSLAASHRQVEAMVITHIDADHIDGGVVLLQDLQARGLEVSDLWFNGWRQLEGDPTAEDVFGAIQGEFLGALIERDKLPWNAAFTGGPVVVPESGLLPRKELAGGAVVTLISPQPRQLRRLRRNWDSVVRDAGLTPGDSSEALNRLEARREYEPPARIEVFGGEEFATDNSVANGSSIAFVLEFEGVSCLLTGDATTPVLTDGLQRFWSERGSSARPFDLVKMPHHGSAANVDATLLALMPSKRYLVSTNGARYHHPDRRAIELVLESRQSSPTEIYFNYNVPTTSEWGDAKLQQAKGYSAIYPSPGQSGITVSLGD